MHTRRLVAFLLGVWLGGIVFVACTTYASSSNTQSILENPGTGPRQLIELSGRERAAKLVQYNTAEFNRSLVESWNWVQLGLGIAVACTLPFAMRLKWGYLIAAVVMFLIVLAELTLITPEIIGVGRLLDMAGGDSSTQDDLWKERRSLNTLQHLYLAAEIIKGVIGAGLTAALLIFRRRVSVKSRSSGAGHMDNAVDNANYSHVDR